MTVEVQQVNPELKRKLDAKRVETFECDGKHNHAYCYDEWRDWTGNNYIKSYYDLLLQDGTILYHCFPNAGVFRKGREGFDKHSKVKIRLSHGYPY